MKLNVPIKKINFAIGSHSHYDHANGFRDMAEHGLNCPLVTGQDYFNKKYAFDGYKNTYLGCGLDADYLIEHGIEHKICGNILCLAEGCYTVGNFCRTHQSEKISDRFVIRTEDGQIQDYFNDEICIVLDTDKGTIVIVGCSHPGIMNILDTVKSHFKKPIRAVVGGTHLAEADEQRIHETLDNMKQIGVQLLGLNHCSGSRIQDILKTENKLHSTYLGVGDCLFI